MAKSLNAAYGFALSLTVHSLHQTREEAQNQVDKWVERVSQADTDGANPDSLYSEPYVMVFSPGSLNDDMYQGSDGLNDYIQFDQHIQFVRPDWLIMGECPILKTSGNPAWQCPAKV